MATPAHVCRALNAEYPCMYPCIETATMQTEDGVWLCPEHGHMAQEGQSLLIWYPDTYKLDLDA